MNPRRIGVRPLAGAAAAGAVRATTWATTWAILSAASLAPATPALAAELKSIGPDPAILYDAPTLRGRRVGVAPRGMPVDPVVTEADWVRVRDSSGEFSWVEKKALTDKRMVIVNTPAGTLATVRADADEAAPIVFQAYPGVLLEWLDGAKPGWTHVRHRDGQTGYVQVSEVWGE